MMLHRLLGRRVKANVTPMRRCGSSLAFEGFLLAPSVGEKRAVFHGADPAPPTSSCFGEQPASSWLLVFLKNPDTLSLSVLLTLTRYGQAKTLNELGFSCLFKFFLPLFIVHTT